MSAMQYAKYDDHLNEVERNQPDLSPEACPNKDNHACLLSDLLNAKGIEFPVKFPKDRTLGRQLELEGKLLRMNEAAVKVFPDNKDLIAKRDACLQNIETLKNL